MTDQPNGGNAAPAPAASPSATPTSSPAVNPRSQAPSPATEQRQSAQQQQAAGKMLVDDVEHDTRTVRDALAAWSEAQVRKQSLPQDPTGYEIKLPPDFRPPAGVQFQFDGQDPLLARARELAHARGIDQDTFSDMLGVFAAHQIGVATQLEHARQAELGKLGSASSNRVAAIETWLKAMTGDKSAPIVNQLKAFPHAAMVEMFEGLISRFSNQGGAQFDQRGRTYEENGGKIAGYEGMSFAQRRVAQMSRNPASPRGRE